MSRLDKLNSMVSPKAPPKAPAPPTRPGPPVQVAVKRPMTPPVKPLVKSAPVVQQVQQVELVKLQPIEHAIHKLNPIEDMEARAREMLASGNDEALVAVQCGVTLSKVFEIRRGVQPAQVVNRQSQQPVSQERPSAKELFARRMRDFDECLEIATAEYKNDPQSEANYNAMNGFMKTLKDLFSAYEELEDPQELAERLIKQIIYPFMQGMIRLNVEAFRDVNNDVGQTLITPFQREQLNDGLKDALRRIDEHVRNEFNRAVKTLETIFEVKMDTLYLRPKTPGADKNVVVEQGVSNAA